VFGGTLNPTLSSLPFFSLTFQSSPQKAVRSPVVWPEPNYQMVYGAELKIVFGDTNSPINNLFLWKLEF